MSAFVFFMICVISASCQFISTPRNQVVIRGEKLRLEWKTESNLSHWKWSFTQPFGIGQTENIFTRTSNNFSSQFSHFHFNESDSSMTIYTDAVKLEDGGNYTFEYRLGDESRSFAVQSTVLESLPRCHNRSIDEDIIELSCSVNFRGFWAPKIKWETIHDNGTAEDYHPEKAEVSVRKFFRNSNVTSSIVLRAAKASKKNFRIRCTTYFTREEDDQLMMNATNIPNFNYTCSWSFSADKTTASEEKKGFAQQISLSLEIILVVAVVAVVLLLVFGLIIAFVVRHKIQRDKLDGKRKLGSDDDQRTGTRRSHDVVLVRDELKRKEDREKTDSHLPFYHVLEPNPSAGETTDELIEIERGTLSVYDEIGHEYDSLTTKHEAEDKERIFADRNTEDPKTTSGPAEFGALDPMSYTQPPEEPTTSDAERIYGNLSYVARNSVSVTDP